MTDSNETLAYENGRDAGYADGYDIGIRDFAERLKSIYTSDKRYDRPYARTWIAEVLDNIDELAEEMRGEGI